MADVNRTSVKRYREETVVQKVPYYEDTYELVLSQDEAEAVMKVLSRVGGVPSGARGSIDEVYRALEGAGIDPNFEHSSLRSPRTCPPHLIAEGHIIFADRDGILPRDRI